MKKHIGKKPGPRPYVHVTQKQKIFLTPLSEDAHRRLSNPADMAMVRVGDGIAERQDIWVLWFRARVALTLARKYFAPSVAESLEPVEAELGELYARLQQEETPPAKVEVSLELRADARAMVDVANEIQRETNRAHQQEVYIAEFDHCEAVSKRPRPPKPA